MKRVACLLILLLTASVARATILVGTPKVSFYMEYGSDIPPFLDGADLSCFTLGAGANTVVTFEIGPTTAYGKTVRAYFSNLYTINASGEYDELGLNTPHGIYHCRAKVTGAAGTAYSPDVVFRMPNNRPSFEAGFFYMPPTQVMAQPGDHVPIAGNAFQCVEADGDPLHVTSFTLPPASQGKLVKQGSGLLFIAAPGYTGGFQTLYKVADNYGLEAPGDGILEFGAGPAFELDHSFEQVAASAPFSDTSTTTPPLPPGTQELTVKVTSALAYQALPQVSWITAAPEWFGINFGGYVTTTTTLRVAPNTSTHSRTGTVLIGSVPFTVEQAAVDGQPLVSPSSGDPGIVGVIYDSKSVENAVKGGWPVRCTISSGRLPPGLTLSPYGEITGIPTVAGSYVFTVKISNASGYATLSQTITVAPTPEGIIGNHVGLAPPSVSLGLLGGAFQFSVTTTGRVSGFITFSGVRYPFTCTGLQADPGGPFLRARIPRPGLSPWQLDLFFNQPIPGADAGQVTDPSTLSGGSSLNICLPTSTLVVPVDMTSIAAGYYTALISDADTDDGARDAGTLSLNVTASHDHQSGSATMAWRMIDGQVISQSSPLTDMGHGAISLPVNLPRAGNQRLLQGIIDLTPSPGAGASQTFLTAPLARYLAPADVADPIATDTQVTVSGTNWTPPAKGMNALHTTPDNVLVFTAGALDNWPWTFTLNSRSIPVFGASINPPTAVMSLTFNATAGIWSGYYYVTATTSTKPARVKELMQGIITPPTDTFAGWSGVGWTLQPAYDPGTNNIVSETATIVSFASANP